MSEISKVKEKCASIDIEDLKTKEFRHKISLSIDDSMHARFQHSMESQKNRVKVLFNSSQGEISLCILDNILGGQKTIWDKTMWDGKYYEEAIFFAEVSVIYINERLTSSLYNLK